MLVIPSICLLLGFWVTFSRIRSIRRSVLISYLLHGLIVLAGSELLGLLDIFRPHTIVYLWLVILALWVCAAIAIRPSIVEVVQTARTRWNPLSSVDRFLALLPIVLMFLALVPSVFATPNTWDSLTYHLPRVLFWFQHGNLSFFPTDDYRLLFNPPLAELMQAHALALSGNYEPAANLVQWTAYPILVIALSLVPQSTGASVRGQILAGMFGATIPAVLLQASTTQNDLLCGALVASGFAFLMMSVQSFSWLTWACGIIGCGLSIATKGTAFLFVPFVSAVPLLSMLRARRLAPVALFVTCLVPSLGWMSRNMAFFGHPFGYQDDHCMTQSISYYRNDFRTIRQVPGVLAQQASLFVASPVAHVNGVIEKAVMRVHDALQTQPDVDGLKWYDTPYHVPLTGPHEDAPPLFWHSAACMAVLLITIVRSRHTNLPRYVLACVAFLIFGFLMSCVYLKWMPWNLRFLWIWPALTVSCLAGDQKITNSRLAPACLIGFWLLAIPFALFSVRRSIIPLKIHSGGRNIAFVSIFQDEKATRLMADSEQGKAIAELADFVAERNPTVIAIRRTGVDPAIYPFLSLLRDRLPEVKFTYDPVVCGASRRIEDTTGTPSLVVTLQPHGTATTNGSAAIFRNSMGRVESAPGTNSDPGNGTGTPSHKGT